MGLFTLISRSLAVKSNRSLNPYVQTNIKLTHCTQIDQVLEIVKKNELAVAQKAFALRMLTRILISKTGQIDYVDNPIYEELTKSICSNIGNLKSLEICDIMFWARNSRTMNISSIDYKSGLELKDLIESLLESNSFTIRQTISLFYDMTLTGIVSEKVYENLKEKVLKSTTILSIEDIKHILLTMKTSRYLIDQNFIENLITRSINLLQGTFLNKDLIEIIKPLALISMRSRKSMDSVKNLLPFIESNLDHIGEHDLYTILRSNIENKNLYSEDFIKKLLHKLKANLQNYPGNFSNIFYSTLPPLLNQYPEISYECTNYLMDEIMQRLQNKKMDLSNISRLSSSFLELNYNVEPLASYFDDRALSFFAYKGFLDVLLMKSKYSGESIFDKYSITDKQIEKHIKMKNLKTLIHYVGSINPSWSADFKKHTEFVLKALDSYILKDSFYARSTLLYFSDSDGILKNKDKIFEYKIKCLNNIDTSREHTHNTILFVIYNTSDSFIENYIKKNKQNIDSEKLAKAIENNLNDVPISKIDVIQKYFPENNSYAILKLIKKKRAGEEVDNQVINELIQIGIKNIQNSKAYQRNIAEVDGYFEKIHQLKPQKEEKKDKAQE
ncbi:hypothetical protein SteCoe_32542 [Stentor coeruleus]|uniref:Uncharacterized protein n=1 Tax=Stentor coeruleus TaxID=5963 RepID=A0A1R2AYV3_9CILI|nr:hypothetical protein SteCoe_32542 [Stentor coeruleus]